MTPLLVASEQYEKRGIDSNSEVVPFLSELLYNRFYFHREETPCFSLFKKDAGYFLDTNYFIGVDWLVKGKAAIYVEPKLNTKNQIDFLGMLLQSLDDTENYSHLEGLFHVDFDKPWIFVPQQKDKLSPILVVQFLKLVQRIVRKGLKKSYYRITENLNSRIKGKILIGEQIKKNIVKNRLTKTVCNYQEYGVNSFENQFLKSVLQFVSSYLNEKQSFFNKEQTQNLQNILHYCSPAFEQVDFLANKHLRIHSQRNPFYKEYEEVIRIGNYILKRFSFNINKTKESQTSIPPFWIDMSKLFELYVFGKLKKVFPEPRLVTYHDPFWGGKETDILLRADGYKCVIDCKYKPYYHDHTPCLDDKRQLAGYMRMKSVYTKLSVAIDKIIKGLIIYAHQDCVDGILKENLFKGEIGEYVEFYKLGVCLPELRT